MKKVIKKVFYPHQKHNPRPLFWHPLIVSLLVIGILFISSFITLQNLEVQNPHSLLGDIQSGVLISFTNKERTDVGIPTLIENETLNTAAQLKANDMAQNGYFAHYTPTGLSPWYWFSQAGYEYQKAGENLAVNFDDSKKVVDAWMDSPTHKANIIKDGYSEIGIATSKGIYKGKKATFVVQLFAAPRVEEATGFAFAIEKKTSIPASEQSMVQGTEISVYQSSNIFQIFSSQTNTLVILLVLLSLIICIALGIVYLKGRPHSKQFYISIIILGSMLIISLMTQFNFFRDISVSILK